MYIVVSYDVIDDKRRGILAKTLLNYGRRVQKSVFECLLEDREYIKMKQEIDSAIDMEVDSVRYYILCRRCVPNISISGMGTVSEDSDVMIV